ncbi:hypothetical protein OPQ81_000440 [Rhizoctonia solani]|nr:hypothetical protein OPQ81_000440 [Rhizoctonia solani]
MPSTTRDPKPKKSIRRFLRDTFGRSSSRPSTAKRPVSQIVFSSGTPNEPHGQTPRRASSLDDVHIPPPKDERPGASHTTPSTLSAEDTTLPTDPPVIRDGSNIDQPPADSHSTTAPSAEPESNLVSTDTATALDTTSTATNAVWAAIRESLQALRDSSSLLLPLASAADTLLGCINVLETSARIQQDHEELVAEIATLSNSLAQSLRTSTLNEISKGVSGVAFGIKRQAQEMEGELYRGTGKESKVDEEEVTRHFGQIQLLFRRLEANLSMNHWSTSNERLVNKRLEGLNPVKQATYDSALSSTINRRTCTPGTRTEILANLAKWVYDPEAPAVHWMNGVAGTGKTTIACTFSESLEREELLAASFFYTRTTAECRDMARMIPTIAYQLAQYSVPFRSALYEVLGGGLDAGLKNNMQSQFERLLRDPLLKVKDSLPDHLVVVIDGLDECDGRNGTETMLDLLVQQTPSLPLKFFVTSRPEPEMSQPPEAVHLHDVEKSAVQTDIELYLKSELTSISPSSAEIKQLVQLSGALFIYAATLVRYIRSGRRLAEPYKRLRSVLSTPLERAPIDTLYTTVLKSAMNEDEVEAEKVEDIRVVLRTVLLAHEPIKVETLATLAGIYDPKRVHLALQPLRPVLDLSEETSLVSTLHSSFPDFMFNQERSGTYFCSVLEHGQALAERCFLVMKEQLRFNMCNLESSFVPDDEVDNLRRRIQVGVSPALNYGCRYWASHLVLVSKSDTLLAMLEEFLCFRLLFWMEVLNVRREMAMGVEGLRKVKRWLNQVGCAPSKLATFVEDALSFVTAFAESPASLSTPHIYISSLPFCPRSSLVFKHYWQRTRGLLELKGSLMEHREAAALATWNMGSEIFSVAYSPDGTRVAVGTEDGAVRILDAHTGTQILSLSQSDSREANSVAFSPDGNTVASGHGGKDCSLRVWDSNNGTLIARTQSCDADIHCVSFSPDGVRLAFGSYGKDVYIWNSQDHTVFQSPMNHFYHVFAVAFSPDGTLVASSSSISTKGTIHLWNSHDGTPVTLPLQGHTGHVMSIAFTPDGTRLVSGSEDKTIRVWNVSDGSPVSSPFKGHTQGIRSVAVSPDGTRVASGSNDRTVRVWKLDGTLVAGPFAGHTARICSVAYSPDGTRVISGSSDHTIRVWNVCDGLRSPPTPFRRHISRLKSISSFGNGAQIVSASEDCSFWVWDVPPCKIVSSPQHNHSPPLQPLPPTGSNVATVSKDRGHQSDTIDSYPLSVPSKSHKDLLTASVVSADSTLLVTGFRNGSIRVWDLRKTMLVAGPLHGHGGEITSLLVSSDHSHVISCSREDTTIRIWDTRNPILKITLPSDHLAEPTFTQGNLTIFEGWNMCEDGWVRDSGSRLLFWIPYDLSSNNAWPSPHAELIISKDGVLQIPEQELLLGEQWSRCYSHD